MSEKDTVAILEVYKWFYPHEHASSRIAGEPDEILIIQYSSKDYPSQNNLAKKLQEEFNAHLKEKQINLWAEIQPILEDKMGKFLESEADKKLNIKTTRRFIVYLKPIKRQ